MTTYFYMIINIALAVLVFGILGPMLISAESDLAVLLGFCLLALTPILFYILYKIWKRGIKNA